MLFIEPMHHFQMPSACTTGSFILSLDLTFLLLFLFVSLDVTVSIREAFVLPREIKKKVEWTFIHHNELLFILSMIIPLLFNEEVIHISYHI